MGEVGSPFADGVKSEFLFQLWPTQRLPERLKALLQPACGRRRERRMIWAV
jgi:hypothetical protein